MQKIGESFAQNLSNQSDLDLISNENFYFIFGIMIKDSLFSQKNFVCIRLCRAFFVDHFDKKKVIGFLEK